ncbi:hypothetical protein PAHAL_1G008700 [Panicum hallii]|jgi:hypothetical protein|uniref:Uncharacterized protein n=1 Tax=Panicum hallii TaxID=206008 RepID=A0A2T8KTJ3_9POAL|nr:hypothetical protein PAHAL_1G008700 [Panicum hallii]
MKKERSTVCRIVVLATNSLQRRKKSSFYFSWTGLLHLHQGQFISFESLCRSSTTGLNSDGTKQLHQVLKSMHSLITHRRRVHALQLSVCQLQFRAVGIASLFPVP